MFKLDPYQQYLINYKDTFNSSISGFAKPCIISRKLAEFLDTYRSLSRIDVTKKINEYVVQNNLRNPNDKREIIPDQVLGDLLEFYDDPTNTQKLTYFNLQSYLKPFFLRPEDIEEERQEIILNLLYNTEQILKTLNVSKQTRDKLLHHLIGKYGII